MRFLSLVSIVLLLTSCSNVTYTVGTGDNVFIMHSKGENLTRAEKFFVHVQKKQPDKISITRTGIEEQMITSHLKYDGQNIVLEEYDGTKYKCKELDKQYKQVHKKVKLVSYYLKKCKEKKRIFIF